MKRAFCPLAAFVLFHPLIESLLWWNTVLVFNRCNIFPQMADIKGQAVSCLTSYSLQIYWPVKNTASKKSVIFWMKMNLIWRPGVPWIQSLSATSKAWDVLFIKQELFIRACEILLHYLFDHTWNHGLQTSNEAFFNLNPKLLCLGRQFGQIYFGAFSTNLSAPILVLWVPCPYFSLINHWFCKKISLYIQIPNIYLELRFEFWPQRISHCVSIVRAWNNTWKSEKN